VVSDHKVLMQTESYSVHLHSNNLFELAKFYPALLVSGENMLLLAVPRVRAEPLVHKCHLKFSVRASLSVLP